MRWIVFLFFLVGYFINDVCSWGPIGHSIVVRLAQNQLKNSTDQWIRSLIPWHWNGNLSALASWADSILYPDSNPTGFANWQWSRVLHYLNVPDWTCAYDEKRDCVNERCIIGAIRNYTQRLEREFDENQLQEALYFLIHFIGDIHQPLHTGFSGDRGGNSIRVRFMNGSSLTNLHAVWDEDIINTRVNQDFQRDPSLYYNHISQVMANQSSPANDDDMSQWIEENQQYICRELYLDEFNQTMNISMNFTIGETYYRKNIIIIEQRLAHAGRRLGRLLNRAMENRLSPSLPKRNNKLCSGTIALIVILSLELILAIIIGLIICYRWKDKSYSLFSRK